jgi:hypothetical protein
LYVNMLTASSGSYYVGRLKTTLNGVTLKINYDITLNFYNPSTPPQDYDINFYLGESIPSFDNGQQITETVLILGSGTVQIVGSVSITATADREAFFFWVDSGPGSAEVTVNSISFGDSTTEEVTVDGAVVTEEICMDIIESCEALEGFVSDYVRLLEDGDYRLLE